MPILFLTRHQHIGTKLCHVQALLSFSHLASSTFVGCLYEATNEFLVGVNSGRNEITRAYFFQF